MRKEAVLVGMSGFFGLALFAGMASGQTKGKTPAPAANPHPKTILSPDDEQAFEQRFSTEIWPLMTRASGGCVGCHTKTNPSQLHFSGEGGPANFQRLLATGFFDPESASSLLGRIASPEKTVRMPPPPAAPWTDAEQGKLREFVKDLYDKVHASGMKPDEMFPAELLDPYTGKKVSGGPDNTFLTYTQLRGKVRTIFGDDWKRNGKDLFQENIAQFGGADFIKRFNETDKASATFLSALDTLSRDVASRAYLAAGGPFAGRPDNLPSPVRMTKPSPAYRAEITRLYRRMLYRSPSEAEIAQAFRFVKNIYAAQQSVAREDANLDFELEVQDSSGRTATQPFRLAASNEGLGVYQEFIDQSVQPQEAIAQKKLDGTFTLAPRIDGQRFEITNQSTNGNVSLAGLELTGPAPETTVKKISVTDPGVNVQGAWQKRGDGGVTTFEDGNNNKGSSKIEIPLNVEKPGKYQIAVLWRKAGTASVGRGRRRAPSQNADAVLVEVHSRDRSVLANPKLPPMPPAGEAHFTIDETVDTIPAWDLRTSFKFGTGPNEGVEISNEGTRRRVVADAVRFEATETGAKEVLVDDPEAEGGWPAFKFPSFRPFNLVGSGAVSDNNEKKGELKIAYKPSKSSDWKADLPYRVKIVFPGQVDNETSVPVIVRAKESTPIIQMSGPLHATVGSTVTLDASTTYNIQRSPLKYTWHQFGGPRVRFSDPHAAKTTFTVEPMNPQQAAWEGLCEALMKHPDFLFTRPRSLQWVKDPKDRRRLQLVKIAQDLVARPPTDAEVKQVDAGAPLSKLIDTYLNSQEFRDFYFRRIQLVLESHGSEADDEPVRLWSYVAFNDLPFQQILTADYTVDADMKKQARPAFYGKTGVLTMKGFIKGKPGLPHFNYAAQVTEKFLGYVYEVPPSIVAMREGITAAATTAPGSVCYSCHKVLTPLAYQRLAWSDDGDHKLYDDGKPIDDTDRGLVPSYPFRGKGLEAFATQAVNKERFVRTIIQTHFIQFFGREMRYQDDERGLYKRLWDNVHRHNFNIRAMLKAMLTSPEYLNGSGVGAAKPVPAKKRTPVRRKTSVASAVR